MHWYSNTMLLIFTCVNAQAKMNTIELPLFPLNLVAFPGEKLNLHVFEPRYKQLIGECLDQGSTFGIPSYMDNRVEYGTEMKIERLVKIYEDGRMDISTLGLRVFKVEAFFAHQSGKLHPGGRVHIIEGYDYETPPSQQEFFETLTKVFQVMELEEKVRLHPEIKAFEIAHKIGFTLNQEYELLQIKSEAERQQFVLGHLRVALPILKQMAKAKEIIQMNGHFKYFNPLEL